MLEIELFKIQMYVVSAIVTFTCLLFTFVQQRTDKLQNKFFLLVNAILLTNIVTSITASFAVMLDDQQTRDFMEYLYFIIHSMLCPFFSMYVILAVGRQRKIAVWSNFLTGLMFFLTEAIAILNPVTRWVYTIDADGVFHRGWGVYAIYVAALFYYVFAAVILFTSWRALTRKRQLAMVYFFLMVAAGVVLQLINSRIRSELFAESLGLLGVMIAIENEDDRIDIDTGFYNRKALQTDIHGHLVNKHAMTVVGVKILNPEIIQRATGSLNTDLLSEVVADFLKSVVPRYQIYNATQECFVLLLGDKQIPHTDEIVRKLSERFETSFEFRGTEIPLKAVILVSPVPGQLKTVEDVMAMADQPLPKSLEKKVLTDSDLDYLMRRVAVEEAVNRGLTENNFEVYYQPTYYLDGRLHGAEALIRLHDTVIGNVFPDEFIPVAEQMGMVDALDTFVFREVCLFLKSGIPSRYHMDCVNVNLSVLHCMQPDFIRKINHIAEEVGIDKNQINFEITESVAASDYGVLSDIVTNLKREGYHFSMDDYGTGYSNMESIFKLDFDVVKIDKSILWSAEKGEVGSIVLENTIRMVRQMHRLILVEGVETQSQIDLLNKLGVDYLQGYFFSRPIPKKEFVELISRGVSA
ncbi:MAG: EAL domain-containing protein [Oscillospiraceae bacterium]|nr:EAL domain-containing protein [Oscillospiraceae bacterium]